MSMQGDQIEAAALKLSPGARARIAGRLLQSLEGLLEEENEAIWIEEAKRRDEGLDAGALAARPGGEVFHEARSRLS